MITLRSAVELLYRKGLTPEQITAELNKKLTIIRTPGPGRVKEEQVIEMIKDMEGLTD